MNIDKNIDDEQLVEQIVASKNTHLFAILYDRYSNVVYNKCLGFTKDPGEAQDLTHDIFINLFLKLRTFKGKSKFSTWLYSFAYNFCLNYVNRDLKKRNNKFVLTDEIPPEPTIKYYQDIEDKDILQMKSEILLEAIDQIDPSDKMILLMRYQDDMSVKEIQEILNIGNSAAKMRLNRAKGRLIEIYNTL